MTKAVQARYTLEFKQKAVRLISRGHMRAAAEALRLRQTVAEICAMLHAKGASM